MTSDELGGLLRLGSKSKSFILLMLHCGRLRSLNAGGAEGGAARYRIAGGSGS